VIATMPIGSFVPCTCGADNSTAGTHSRDCPRSNAGTYTLSLNSHLCNCQNDSTSFINGHESWCGSQRKTVEYPLNRFIPTKIPEPTSRHYRRRAAKLAREKPRLDKITQTRLKKLLARLV